MKQKINGKSLAVTSFYLWIHYNIKTYLVNGFKLRYNGNMKQIILPQIHCLLIEKRKTVSIAESCTGGLLSEMLTRISGSSRYFILGIVSYSSRAKNKFLRVPNSILLKKGAVSYETCRKMAQSVRNLSGSDFGIGITGIAGPTGGTPENPLGTVFIAVASKNKNICRKFNFKGSRSDIRKSAAIKSLELLKELLIT